MSALVRPQLNVSPSDMGRLLIAMLRGGQQLDRDFISTLVDTTDELHEQLPRAYGLIGKSATRFCSGNEKYAQSGGAMARKLEMLAVAA